MERREFLDTETACPCGERFQQRAIGEQKVYCSVRCRDRYNKRTQRASGYRRPPTPPCSVADCERISQARGLCSAHYQRFRAGKPLDAPMRKRRECFDLCSVEACGNTSWARGFCPMHYWRWRQHGDVGGAESLRPGGSVVNRKDGYVSIHDPTHPAAKSDGYVLEHRLVMERHLRRSLLKHENIHHINGDRADNRLENLELWSKSQPAGQRVTDKVAWAIELLELYAPEVLASKPTQLRLA
jgi:hypothetical protein